MSIDILRGFWRNIAKLISRLAGQSSQTLNGGVREQAFFNYQCNSRRVWRIQREGRRTSSFRKIRISNHADPGCCVGFCWGQREITDADAHALRNAGVPASGGGPIAAPAQRERNGSEPVNYWFGAPSSDAPRKYKFAIRIPPRVAALVDDGSCQCGFMRAVYDDTYVSEILEASRSDASAESPAYACQTGRPARRAG